MTHMTRTANIADDLLHQMNQLHGSKHIPDDFKKRFDTYMGLANKCDRAKVVDPFIPESPLGFDQVEDPEKTIFREIYRKLIAEAEAENCSCSGESASISGESGSQEEEV